MDKNKWPERAIQKKKYSVKLNARTFSDLAKQM